MGSEVRPPLVGRARELAVLEGALGRVAAGSAAVVLVTGEAGVGKSRLLDEASDQAAAMGLQVVRGAGGHLEHTCPFGVVAEAFGLRPSSADPERARLARLLEGGDEAAPADHGLLVGEAPRLRFLLVEGIVGLVERIASQGPVVLVLDDLHLADPSSLLAVQALGRRLADLPLALLLGWCSSPRSAGLDSFAADLGGAVRLRPGTLDDAAVDALVTDLIGATPGEGLRTRLRGAGGNPLLVVELIRALMDQGALRYDGGTADVQGPGLPSSLQSLLLDRTNHLPEQTRQVLRMASVLGANFRVDYLGLVIGHPPALLAALEEAMHCGLAQESARRLMFRHVLVWETNYEDIAPSIRAGLHRVIAELAESGEPAIRVGEHLARGALPADMQAARRLHDVAREATQRAPAVAVELLERAVKIVGRDAPHQGELLTDLVVDLLWSGRAVEAEQLAREALAYPHTHAVTSRLRLGLVQALAAQGKFLEGSRESERAARQPDLPDKLRPWLHAMAAWRRLLTWDLDGAAAAADAAQRIGEEVGDDVAVCCALCALAQVEQGRGRVREGLALVTRAVERADRSGSAIGHMWPSHLHQARALVMVDRLDDAEAAALKGSRLSEELGAVSAVSLYRWVLALVHYEAGQWDEAIADARTTITLATDSGARLGMHAALATIAVHRNDLRTARQELARAEAELTSGAASPLAEFVLWARAKLAEARGDTALQLAALEAAWQLFAGTGVLLSTPHFGPPLVRLYVAAGRTRDARAVSALVHQGTERLGTATAYGAALRCHALAFGEVETMLEAVAVSADSPRPLMRAGASEDAGRMLFEAGRIAEAIDQLERALALYEGLGARRDEARTRAALRSLGVRRRRSRASSRRTGWPSLTPTELEVVRLLAEGLTNRAAAERLYISPRTVETHVGHVFAKLGVSTRAALLAEAVRHPAEDRSA